MWRTTRGTLCGLCCQPAHTDLGTNSLFVLNGDNVGFWSAKAVRVDMSRLRWVGQSKPSRHVVIAQGMETMVLAQTDTTIANDLSWRSGMLVFDQRHSRKWRKNSTL